MGCAIVAAAYGKIDSNEKQKMTGYMSRSEDLKVFDMSDVITRFNHWNTKKSRRDKPHCSFPYSHATPSLSRSSLVLYPGSPS
ncbi:TerB family tellurite resistance protein [Paenibacillus sp. LPE1-1-1.1]|uniref:TerB family tellurite resistance protein n=1 Tax=Paenibacillus sp. LPE1-1-1.1 TaxID=3135230 RepID=UPI003421A3B6